ncbi:MAG: SDR family oxidoreductase [Aggregatilineales bacterium]
MSMNLFNLSGRSAIVTGGNGDIGRAIAQGLYDCGADVLIVGRSETTQSVADELGSDDRPVHGLRIDLADREALRQGFADAVAKLGKLDILINCHGIGSAMDSVDFDIEDWDKTLEVNLTSVFLLCQLAGKHMLERGRGKIINIASMTSYTGGLRIPAYTASKGGISQLTMALANEWSAKGVNVNAIAPGYIKTNLNPHVWGDPVRHDQILGRLPSGRWGNTDDLKGAAIFLASAASDYVHGVTLPVDGGFLSW